MPDFDTADASIIQTFGEDVTYTPNAGAPVVIKAFFQLPDERPDTFDVEFQGNDPQATTLASDTPAPNQGDTFIIRGVTYTVKQFEVDESALRVFLLLEA
jgi:hypothetical protein